MSDEKSQKVTRAQLSGEGMTRAQEIKFMKYMNENLRPVVKKRLELGNKLSPTMERLARSADKKQK